MRDWPRCRSGLDLDLDEGAIEQVERQPNCQKCKNVFCCTPAFYGLHGAAG